MTRLGFSPNVTFPRILGIECVGVIAASVNAALPAGTTAAAIIGEMGREFDGGYAECALLPDELLIPVGSSLDWPVLGALPETYLTAWARCRPSGSPATGSRGRCWSVATVPRWAWPAFRRSFRADAMNRATGPGLPLYG